ncbi:DUF898 family protein [Riemerella anatipestifer]|uniref:DUF898 family protein n=1 Tax=Riemerella anatipestifer TaxID=34085 RepID=UPI003977809A
MIIPFAIHGSFRYRMSRTSYRGIRFGYRGNRKEFIKKFLKWTLFTIVTFGIYAAWFHYYYLLFFAFLLILVIKP